LIVVHIKGIIYIFIFYFFLSIITKHDIKTVTLSCTPLPNIILSLSFFFLSYLSCLCLLCLKIVIKCYPYLYVYWYLFCTTHNVCLYKSRVDIVVIKLDLWLMLRHGPINLFFIFFNVQHGYLGNGNICKEARKT